MISGTNRPMKLGGPRGRVAIESSSKAEMSVSLKSHVGNRDGSAEPNGALWTFVSDEWVVITILQQASRNHFPTDDSKGSRFGHLREDHFYPVLTGS